MCGMKQVLSRKSKNNVYAIQKCFSYHTGCESIPPQEIYFRPHALFQGGCYAEPSGNFKRSVNSHCALLFPFHECWLVNGCFGISLNGCFYLYPKCVSSLFSGCGTAPVPKFFTLFLDRVYG